MTHRGHRGTPAILAWCDQRTIELLQTGLHPAPRLFPPIDHDPTYAESTGNPLPTVSPLRDASGVLTVLVDLAKTWRSRCTSLFWGEAVR